MLTAADSKGACKLLNDYLTKYKLVTEFNEDEFAHWFLPRKNIIDTFVVENDGQVTDMVSFYTLPSTVMSHPAYDRWVLVAVTTFSWVFDPHTQLYFL